MNTSTASSPQNAISALFSGKTYFLWDFDGCFADTERLHYLAYSQAFAQFGHTLSEREYYPSFTHLGDGTGREIEKYNLKTTVDKINSLKKDNYWKIINSAPVQLFPETTAILQILAALGGGHGRIAIASNSPTHEIEVILKRAGYTGPLHALIGRTDTLRKKPAPDIFLHALKELGGNAAQAVVFEDSERGLAAAHSAHCDAIWMRTKINENLSTTVPHKAHSTHAHLLQALRELQALQGIR